LGRGNGVLEELDPAVAEAVREARGAARAHPRDAGELVRLGMTYEANDLVSFAVDAYARAVAVEPEDGRAWFRLAVARARSGDLAGAEEAMQEASQRLAASAAPLAWLGHWRLDGGDLAGAERAFRRALELDGGARDPAYGLVPLHLARLENEAALELIAEHDLLSGPNAAYGQQLLGTAYRQLGRAAEADAALALSSATAPRWLDPYEGEVRARRAGRASERLDVGRLMSAGRFEEAAARLVELGAREGDAETANNLAVCYLESGRASDALAVLEAALAREPRDPRLNLNAARALLDRSPPQASDTTRALACLQTAEEAQPQARAVYTLRATALERAGRIEDAIEALRLADRVDARDATALVEMGRLQARASRLGDAEQSFRQALEREPRSAAARLGLAMLCIELARLDDAERLVSEVETLGGADPAQVAQVAQVRRRLAELGRGRR